MCHDNQRCAGQVLALQDVSKAVELRRFIEDDIAECRSISDALDPVFEPSRIPIAYLSGSIDRMHKVLKRIDELWPDYTHCDNPPAA